MTSEFATNDPAELRRWIGRTETLADTFHLKQARLMELTLDRPRALGLGDALPALWHWIYFPAADRLSALGRDGHAARGKLVPPVALPRRMWAGGRVRWERPLIIGQEAVRTSVVTGVEMKQGNHGQMCFVTISHALRSPVPRR